MSAKFTIRFTGKDIKPESFTLDELQALFSKVKMAMREFGKSPSEISLVSIRRGSAAYAFAADSQEAADTGVQGIADSLLLPPRERTAKQREVASFFEKINRDKNCRSVLYNSRGTKVLEFRKKATPEAEPASFVEHTSLVGKVVSAGGTKNPSADIICQDGKRVTIEGTEAQIKELAARLYQDVRVDGVLVVGLHTGIDRMDRISAIAPYEKRNIVEVLDELRAKFGDRLNMGDSVNPVAYQRSMRG